MKIIILAAGLGSRLGMPFPKCLTKINKSASIMDLQLKNFSASINDVIVVVGYKKELIMEEFPNLYYTYNPRFDTTNTSKSLLAALNKIENEDVLWVNGDVVFDRRIIDNMLNTPTSLVAVNTASVGEEEVKYTVDNSGFILELSKKVKPALGEAIGINLVKAHDLSKLRSALELCEDQDYFERGIELAIASGCQFQPYDISKYSCIEIDFQEDLQRAKHMFQASNKKQATQI